MTGVLALWAALIPLWLAAMIVFPDPPWERPRPPAAAAGRGPAAARRDRGKASP